MQRTKNHSHFGIPLGAGPGSHDGHLLVPVAKQVHLDWLHIVTGVKDQLPEYISEAI